MSENLEIYKADGTKFNDIVLHKYTFSSSVMGFNAKIEGDFVYKDNGLSFSMNEYVVYNGQHFYLTEPPTIVKKGLLSENSENKGMAKYSCVFYHEEVKLYNIPFTDVAVKPEEFAYRTEAKNFYWIGTLTDFVTKINCNLARTQWVCRLADPSVDDGTLSDVISFDNQMITDVCKTCYETYKVPFTVGLITDTSLINKGYKYEIVFGKPSNEIIDYATNKPFIFQFGQGVGLVNNDRTPQNNQIVTRIAPIGSSNNIPYDYPQIYDSVGNKAVHPFTRDHLMPPIYVEQLKKKIKVWEADSEHGRKKGEFMYDENHNNIFDANVELIDYYDAINNEDNKDDPYVNEIVPNTPSYHSETFDDIKPSITNVIYNGSNEQYKGQNVDRVLDSYPVKYTSNGFEKAIYWDNTIDDESNYNQPYFAFVLKPLGFDLYAQASVTSAMQVSMTSGNAIGATFEVEVDWEDVKKNFYYTDSEGEIYFRPNGSQRDYNKYPDSTDQSITIILKKEDSTFGTLMPNQYQYPQEGDKFVFLSIEMPQTYITEAENRLKEAGLQYMHENNVAYFDYPVDFDSFFLNEHRDIAEQIKTNSIVRFKFANEILALSVQNLSITYNDDILPKYKITLTDDVSIQLNSIGQVNDGLSKLGSQVASLEASYNVDVIAELKKKLSKEKDDTANGYIKFVKGLGNDNFDINSEGDAEFNSVNTDKNTVGNYTNTTGGFFGIDTDGKSYLETDKLYVRFKAYFDSLEVNRVTYNAGKRIAGAAGVKVSKVVETSDSFRCYYLAYADGVRVQDGFEENDLCFSQTFNVQQGTMTSVGNRRYWRALVNQNKDVDEDGYCYIDLSKDDCEKSVTEPEYLPIGIDWDKNLYLNWNTLYDGIEWDGYAVDDSGEELESHNIVGDIPMIGDYICQLGNKSNLDRQNAIIENTVGNSAPSYTLYKGISTYSLTDTEMFDLGYNISTKKAFMKMYGDCHIGDKIDSTNVDTASYISYTQEQGLRINLGNGKLLVKGKDGKNVLLLGEDNKISNDFINLDPLTLTSANIPTLGEIEGFAHYDIQEVSNTGVSRVMGYSSVDVSVDAHTELLSVPIDTKTGKAHTSGYIGFSAYSEGESNHQISKKAESVVVEFVRAVNAATGVTTYGKITPIKAGNNNYKFKIKDLERRTSFRISISATWEATNPRPSQTTQLAATATAYIAGYNKSSRMLYSPDISNAPQKTIVGANGFVSQGKGTLIHLQSTDETYNGNAQNAGVTILCGEYGMQISSSGIRYTDNGGINWNIGN